MPISKNELENNVPATDQLSKKDQVKITSRENGLKVLFIGNSITCHGYRSEIGWYGVWGMAASAKEKDYVHQTVSMLENRYGKVNFCIAQLAIWERDYQNGKEILDTNYTEARDFSADIVVVRIGENMPKGSAPACKPQFEEMISYFLTNPNAKVVITDSFWKNDERDEMIRQIAQERGYHFCRINDLENDPATMALGVFEHRGVSRHPSDYGMEMIAKRLVNVMEGII